jgi:hypothetical protein
VGCACAYEACLQTLTLYRVCLDAQWQHLVSHDFCNGRLLTTQRFQPKLPLTKEMPRSLPAIRLFGLLLAIIFLGAQLHFCADLTGAPSNTHICPVCSAVGAAVMTRSLGINLVCVINPLEMRALAVANFPEIPRGTSPRAPPAS